MRRAPTVTEVAHRALDAARQLAWTGTLHVVRSPAGVLAHLAGVGVVAPAAPVRWGTYHTRAVALFRDADALQPLGAWEWRLSLRAGVPQSDFCWISLGLDADS